MRTLLLVSGGLEALPAVRRARAMGLRVVVSDADPRAPGLALADDRLLASTYDAEATLREAEAFRRRGGRIDGVLCVAADVPVTVARVAEALGLPGIPLESARLAVDKLAMKRRFREDGVAVPWFAAIESPAALRRAVAERGYPLVVKPVDSRGARGVLRLTPEVELESAFAIARSHSPSGRVLVEEFLEGPQVSTESLVLDGIAYTPGFSDRNYELLERYAPHVIENGGDLPSALPPSVQADVRRLVQDAARSLGVRDGVVKGDVVVAEGVPHVIELAARLSGGYFCTHEIPLNTGVDFVGSAIRVALGERPDPAELAPRFERCVSQRYLFPAPGRVRAVRGAAEVARRPGIEMLELRVQPGDAIGPVDRHPARAGVVLASGATREEARARAEEAVRDVRVEVESPAA